MTTAFQIITCRFSSLRTPFKCEVNSTKQQSNSWREKAFQVWHVWFQFYYKKAWKDTIYWSMKEWKISNVIFVMLALHKRPSWMDTWHQFMKEKSLSNATYLMLALQKKFEGRKPFKLLIMDVLWIHSYWGKYNPNLENCSYYEGRKPYYILKNFLSI